MSRPPVPIRFDPPGTYAPYAGITCQVLYVAGVYFNAPRLEWFQGQVGVIRTREDALQTLIDHAISGREYQPGDTQHVYAHDALNRGSSLCFEIADANGNNRHPVLVVPPDYAMEDGWVYDPTSEPAITRLWFSDLWRQIAPGSNVAAINTGH